MANLLATFFRPAATALVSLACFTPAEATAQTNPRVQQTHRGLAHGRGPSFGGRASWPAVASALA